MQICTNTKMYSSFNTNMGGFAEDALKALIASGMITESGVINAVKKNRTETILREKHSHKIWYAENAKCWRTFVPDDTKPKGRRKVERNTKEALEDYLCEYYEEQPAELTLKGIYAEWLEYKSELVKSQSIKKVKGNWKRFYENSEIIEMPLTDLDKLILEKWAHRMIKKWHMTKHTYGDFSAIINQMLDYATEKKYIKSNPFKEVKIIKSKKLYFKERKPDGEMIFFEDEQAIFEDHLWETYSQGRHKVQLFLPLAIVFDFYEGLRDCELAALKWSDIDGDKLHVQRMVDSLTGEIVNRTKGGKPRSLPLHPEAIKVLTAIKQMRIKKGLPLDFVFCTNGSPISTYKAIEKYMPKYCKEVGLIERNIHTCRRTWISTLIDAGVNVHTVAEWAGHESVETTWKNYVYNRKREEVRNAEYINALTLKRNIEPLN